MFFAKRMRVEQPVVPAFEGDTVQELVRECPWSERGLSAKKCRWALFAQRVRRTGMALEDWEFRRQRQESCQYDLELLSKILQSKEIDDLTRYRVGGWMLWTMLRRIPDEAL